MAIRRSLQRLLSSATSFLHSLTYSPIRYAVIAIVFFYVTIVVWEFHFFYDINEIFYVDRQGIPRITAGLPFILVWLLVIGLVIVLFRAFRKYQQRREEVVSAESAHTISESPAIKSLLLSLRRRALGLRLVSWFILGLTFASIISGLYIFTAAGEIARGDSYLYRLEENLAFRDMYFRRLIDDLRQAIDASNDPNKSLALAEVQKWRERDESATQEVRESLRRVEQTYGSNERLYFFLSATSTRVGSILMLIFLVQILLSVYRYSIRMVSYYEARADALLLYGGENVEQLQSFVSALSAEKVEFGKAPQSPAEQAIELIKSVSTLRK